MFDNFPLGRFRQFLLHLSRRGNVGATEIDTGDVLIGLVLEDQGLAKSSIGKPTNCAIVQLTKKGFLSLPTMTGAGPETRKRLSRPARSGRKLIPVNSCLTVSCPVSFIQCSADMKKE